MSSSVSTPDQPAATPQVPAGLEVGSDRQRRARLRRMKALALGFLLAAAVLYLVSEWQLRTGGPAAFGYLRAAGEAGMVGALADWFAVTALFRRPLGLPIPHTAIIPNRKDALGDSLGEFVGTNFLSEDAVRDKLQRAEVPRRVAAWIAQPDNAAQVTAELATLARGAITVLRDEDVQQILHDTVVRRLIAQPWSPTAGRLLGQVLADGAHRKLVDLICDRAYDWVEANYATVLRVVSDRAPSWSPRFVDSMLADRIYQEVLAFAFAVRNDAEHPMRGAVDTFLAEFAHDLRYDPSTIERAEQVKRQILSQQEVGKLIASLWDNAKELVLEAADDPDSTLRKRVQEGLMEVGERFATDAALRAKADEWLEGVVLYVVRNYRRELTSLITDTVDRWDGRETSRKVELQVGRDLQFIRINGTVVGALAGLAIYSLTDLLF